MLLSVVCLCAASHTVNASTVCDSPSLSNPGQTCVSLKDIGQQPQIVASAKVYIGSQEEFLHGSAGWALEWAAQGGGGIPIPGGI